MTHEDVMAWLEEHGSEDQREAMTRYGIPNERAFGISVGDLRKFSNEVGRSHTLAGRLWDSGWYEARMLAVFIDDPDAVTGAQMDNWAHDFDSWAICDTACFQLFDRTAWAWDKSVEWASAEEEFVKRAAYALVWALSVHDKKAEDALFLRALDLLEGAEPDSRTYVKKGMDMALRAMGKRNRALNRAAIEVAGRLVDSPDEARAWIGRHASKELSSEKVQGRLER